MALSRKQKRVLAGVLGVPLGLCLLGWSTCELLEASWNRAVETELKALADDGLGTEVEVLQPPLLGANGADDLASIGYAFEELPDEVSLVTGMGVAELRSAMEDREGPAGYLYSPNPDDPRCPPDARGAAAMIAAQVDTVEAQLDRGLAQPSLFDFNWEDGFEAELPHLMSLKDLAAGLLTRAAWNALEGRPAKAWADVERILRLGAASEGLSVITHLVQIAIIKTGLAGVRDLLRDGAALTPEAHARLAELLIALDESAKKGSVKAMRGELRTALGSLRANGSEAIRGEVSSALALAHKFLPLETLYATWRLDYVRFMGRVIRTYDLPATEALLKLQRLDAEAYQLTILAKLLLPNIVKFRRKGLDLQAELGLTLTALDLYVADRLPARLTNPRVDPWDPNGAPFHYRRVDAGRALVWSVSAEVDGAAPPPADHDPENGNDPLEGKLVRVVPPPRD